MWVLLWSWFSSFTIHETQKYSPSQVRRTPCKHHNILWLYGTTLRAPCKTQPPRPYLLLFFFLLILLLNMIGLCLHLAAASWCCIHHLKKKISFKNCSWVLSDAFYVFRRKKIIIVKAFRSYVTMLCHSELQHRGCLEQQLLWLQQRIETLPIGVCQDLDMDNCPPKENTW